MDIEIPRCAEGAGAMTLDWCVSSIDGASLPENGLLRVENNTSMNTVLERAKTVEPKSIVKSLSLSEDKAKEIQDSSVVIASRIQESSA